MRVWMAVSTQACPSLVDSQPCNVDCRLTGWSAWSMCDGITGTRQRARAVVVMPQHRGKQCGVLTDYADCAHCKATPWTPYG